MGVPPWPMSRSRTSTRWLMLHMGASFINFSLAPMSNSGQRKDIGWS